MFKKNKGELLLTVYFKKLAIEIIIVKFISFELFESSSALRANYSRYFQRLEWNNMK